MKLYKILIFTVFSYLTVFLSGCSSRIVMQSFNNEEKVKEFSPPPEGWSGLYIFRKKTFFGQALKKNIYIDGQYIGESASCSFFYRLVKPGEHLVQTESEFSENGLNYIAKEGHNHFIQQYVRVGVFVGGANLEETTEENAKKMIMPCGLAKNKDNKALDLPSANYAEGKGSVAGPLESK